MRPIDRWILALLVVLVDALAFAVPLTALLAAWLIVARPPWFRSWVQQLYAETPLAGPRD